MKPDEVERIVRILNRYGVDYVKLTGGEPLLRPDIVEIISRLNHISLREISLTTKAVSVLEYLMLHPDEVLSRERLLDGVWGWDYPAATRAVDTRIAELRRLLKDDAETPRFIETLIGLGYRFIGRVEVGA